MATKIQMFPQMCVALCVSLFCIELVYSACDIPYCAYCRYDGTECLGCYPGRGRGPSDQCELYSEIGMENCLRSDEHGVCTHCENGYGLTDNNTCVECENKGCRVCEADLVTCSWCADTYGHISKNNTCIACPEGCSDCDLSDNESQMICDDCIYGYGLIEDDLSVPYCVKCEVENCHYCRRNISQCNLCNHGFTLSQENKHCTVCPAEHCFACDQTTAMCTWCELGYKLIGETGECDQYEECGIVGCKTCTEGSGNCTRCSDGFHLAGNMCTRCSVEECSVCPDEPGVCVDCNASYHLHNNRCLRNTEVFYLSHCLTIHANQRGCEVCAEGYHFDDDSVERCVENEPLTPEEEARHQLVVTIDDTKELINTYSSCLQQLEGIDIDTLVSDLKVKKKTASIAGDRNFEQTLDQLLTSAKVIQGIRKNLSGVPRRQRKILREKMEKLEEELQKLDG